MHFNTEEGKHFLFREQLDSGIHSLFWYVKGTALQQTAWLAQLRVEAAVDLRGVLFP